MNKNIQTFFSSVILITVLTFCGIGFHRTVCDYLSTQRIDGSDTNSAVCCPQTTVFLPPSSAPAEDAEFISGPLTAETGELCVFRLNDLSAKADWVVIPAATAYIDSSGSSLCFSSNVPARYTVIAAVITNGQPKILTHIVEYGRGPEPNPEPIPPTPKPPANISDWVSQNVPSEGRSQAAALAECYESAAGAIDKGTIRTTDAAFALLRSASQTKVSGDVWKKFLDDLSNKITETLKDANDIKELGSVFLQVAEGLKRVSDIEAEISTIPAEISTVPETLVLPSSKRTTVTRVLPSSQRTVISPACQTCR